MSRLYASLDPRDPRGGDVVRKPRASDAIGGSLRNSYETDLHLPADWIALLQRLDLRAH